MTVNNFDYAFHYVLKNEGGYSDDLDDPGGATNYGITQKELESCHKSLRLPKDVKNLTIEDAYKYYKYKWDSNHYDDINSQKIAIKLFDLCVNLGTYESTIILQRAINACAYGFNLKEDGILGQKTIYAVNSLHIDNKDELLLNNIRKQAVHVYELIIKNKPQLKKFEKGWLKRANE